MSTTLKRVHGYLAEFDNVQDLYHAAEHVRDAGYNRWDVHTPFPVHGMDKAMGNPRSILPKLVFCGGITGTTVAFILQTVTQTNFWSQTLGLKFVEDIVETYPTVVQAKPIEWVTAAYGKFLPKGHKPSVAGTNDYLSAAGLGVRGDNMRPDSANVIEAWIKPNMTEFLPEGGMITVVDDVIVQASIHGLPYEHRQYPLAPFRHIPTGKFYTASTIEALIPLQREYNRTASQIVEAKNRMGKPQMFYREGSIEPTKITSESGATRSHTVRNPASAGHAPDARRPASVPSRRSRWRPAPRAKPGSPHPASASARRRDRRRCRPVPAARA